MFCSYCGKQISEDSNFCTHCGAHQILSAVGNPALQAPPPNKPPKKKSRLFAVLVFVLCASLLVVFLGNYLFKSDEQLINDRIDDFLKAYNTGDMSGAIKCLDAKTRNAFQSVMNMGNALIGATGFGLDISDLFGASIGTISEGDILTVSDRSITFDSETSATVIVTLSYQDKYSKKSEPAVFTMVKEDGDWFIKNLEDQ